MIIKRFKSESGVILAVSLMVVFLIAMFTLSYVVLARLDTDLINRQSASIKASQSAKAGLERAIYYIDADSDWNSPLTETIAPSGASYTIVFNPGTVPWSTSNKSGAAPVTGYNGREVPAGMIHIVSTGRYKDATAIEEIIVKPGTGGGGGYTPFEVAVFVLNNILLNGSAMIDSWNSSEGNYYQTVQMNGADIGSNATGTGIVSLSGNSHVFGTITAGTGSNSSTAVQISGSSTYMGFTTDDPQTFPIITPTPGTNQGSISPRPYGTHYFPPGTYQSMNGTGSAQINLSEGTYIFLGNFNLSGSSNIYIPPDSGRVNIFVLGNINVPAYSIRNMTGIPGNLVFIGGEDTETVNFSANGNAYCAVYAPNATVNITGSANLFGSVVAYNLNLTGGSAFHFDLALKEIAVTADGSSSGGSGSSEEKTDMIFESRW